MTTVRLSTGEKISRREFDLRISKAKKIALQKQFYEVGYNYCVDCYANPAEVGQGIEYVIKDCSHEIPVSKCINTGHAEYAYDPDNIKIRCRYHHKIHDNM